MDYRFPVVAIELSQTAVNKNNLQVLRLGGFRRAYKKELASVEDAEEIEASLHSGDHVLKVHSNGLYDHLPEELFHYQGRIENFSSLSFPQKHRIKKEEEKEARHFFHPFENEFSSLLIDLEYTERQLIENGFYSSEAQSLFEEFKFEAPENGISAEALIYFYPLIPHFRANIDFLAFVLTSVLHLPVSCRFLNHPQVEEEPSAYCYLGESFLGKDTFVGGQYNKTDGHILIEVNELQNKDTEKFLADGEGTKAINFCVNLVMPFDFIYQVKLSFALNQDLSCFSENTRKAFLGYNTFLSC